jgi:hypothetical protein
MFCKGTRVGDVRCWRMPTFQISVANSEFATEIEQEFENIEEAKSQALKGVLDLASEQVVAGTPFFGAEVNVTDGRNSKRFIVAIGVSPLQ